MKHEDIPCLQFQTNATVQWECSHFGDVHPRASRGNRIMVRD